MSNENLIVSGDSERNKAMSNRPRRRWRLVLWFFIVLIAFVLGAASREWGWYPIGSLKAAYWKLFGSDDKAPAGLWNRVDFLANHQGDPDFNGLDGLGYIAGHEPAPEQTAVVVHVPGATEIGYNLYCSGHAPEVVLMNMDGDVLHRWYRDFEDIWPDRTRPDNFGVYIRRCHLYDNGDILAVYDESGLVRLDRDSNVVWTFDERAHHDVDVGDDGRIYVLTHYLVERPKVRTGKKILDDHVVVLSAEGKVLDRVSLIDAFMESPFSKVLMRVPARNDVFHTNTVEVLDGRFVDRHPAFAAGNVLVSLREMDIVAVVDMKKHSVAWIMWGMWKHQHHPTMLDNGDMLVFDNLGHYGLSKVFEFDPFAQSAIQSYPYTEFDPLRQKVKWSYEGTVKNRFFSRFCGTAQRLGNGNTLITQSDIGRVFEVTPDQEIVWEFFNPNRAGENDELIAVIFEMQRLPSDDSFEWLERQP